MITFQLSAIGPFPRGICRICYDDFGTVSSFFVNLNEGQARLAELLRQNENINIYMPDWMSEKKTLFSAKYPAFERCTKKKKAKGKPEVEEQTNIIPMSRKSVSRDTKTDIELDNKGDSKENSDTQLEHAMEEIFREKEADMAEKGKPRISEPSARKRVRKLPKR